MTGPIGSLRLTVKAMRGGWAPFSPLRPLRPWPPVWPWGPRSPLGPLGPCIPHSPFCPLRPRWPFAPFSPGTPCGPATHSLPLSHVVFSSRHICLNACMIMVFCTDLKKETNPSMRVHCLYGTVSYSWFALKRKLCVCVGASLSTIWKEGCHSKHHEYGFPMYVWSALQIEYHFHSYNSDPSHLSHVYCKGALLWEMALQLY